MQRPISELLQRSGVVIYTGPSTSVKDAVTTMSNHNVGSIVILEDNRELVGIFTERDLLNRVVNEGLDPATTPIREVMTDEVIVVSGDTPRRDVLNLMNEKHIRHVPVADDGELYGVISLRDLLRFENEMKDFEIEQLREYVTERPYPAYPA
jgi:CBS domain-containing protein